MLTFVFDKEKAETVILYIANKLERASVDSVFLVMYFADKTHLEKYGRSICGNAYTATADGVVPIEVNLMLVSTYDHSRYIVEHGVILGAVKPDLNQLSQSDIKCLDMVLKLFALLPMWLLIQLGKDEAWAAARKSDKVVMSVESIVGLLEASEDILEHLKR